MKKSKISILFLIILLSLPISAQYQLKQSVFGSGGSPASNGTYQLNGTVGQPFIGVIQNGTYQNKVGFWYTVQPRGQIFTQAVSGDWNMIGLPLSVTNSYYLSLYPDALPGTLFGFNGSYFLEDSLELGLGYWLRFPAPDVIPIQGSKVENLTLTLSEGWNMIAGVSCDIPLASVNDPDGILVAGTLFGFNGSYFLSDSIVQGNGYWIRADSAGQISLSCDTQAPAQLTGSGISKKVAKLREQEKQFATLVISDASGSAQKLYHGGELKDPEDKLSYSMPPLPPRGAFDARFSGNFRLSEKDEATIRIQASQYPVVVDVSNIGLNGDYTYLLKEVIGDKAVAVHDLKEGERIEIVNPDVKLLKLSREKIIPVTFEVAQNYPNPFNPTTTIKYAIPEKSTVDIIIYNTLGQKVKTLVSGDHEAGYYKVVWDATNNAGVKVGSGIYYYTVKAGKNNSVKKMVLIR